jgi:hypothetical protein
VYGKSQLLVWGAAINTLLAAWDGKAPSIRQPVKRKVATEKARSKVLTTGVSKMVWCMDKKETPPDRDLPQVSPKLFATFAGA